MKIFLKSTFSLGLLLGISWTKAVAAVLGHVKHILCLSSFIPTFSEFLRGCRIKREDWGRGELHEKFVMSKTESCLELKFKLLSDLFIGINPPFSFDWCLFLPEFWSIFITLILYWARSVGWLCKDVCLLRFKFQHCVTSEI